jgi:phenylpropionate dioxygenase-like ring-hydroxylating dioxygenase large terminal subunit
MEPPSIAELVRPNEVTFAAHDRDVLASFWHPVALASEVADKPLSRRLLDVRLVVFRGEDGICVARDLCAHRGASLSRGWMDGCTLVCAYHGFRYSGTGACTGVPAQDASIPISQKLRLRTFPAVVRHGLVWTCLRPPAAAPVPEWPDLALTGRQTIEVPVSLWRAAAPRQVENFNDVAHLSWVHTGTFGNRDAPQIHEYDVVERPDALEFRLSYPHVDRDTFLKPGGVVTRMTYVYTLSPPFATKLGVLAPDGRILDIYDIASPETARQTRVYMLMSRNYDLGDPAAPAIDYQLFVNKEDLPVVEDQYPEDLPLDLREEVHISADRMSIAYRKRLVAIGLSGHWVA